MPLHESIVELADEADRLNAQALGIIDTARQRGDLDKNLRNALWAAQDALEVSMKHQKRFFEVAMQRPDGGE